MGQIKAPVGATTRKTIVGRGASSKGRSCGRGHDGQKSRSGGGVRLGFEGGQMPLYRRIPKRGFTNIFGKKYEIINIDDLNKFDAGTVVTPAMLEEAGFIKQVKDGVKVLGDGTLEKNVSVQAQKFSKTAIEKIEAAGGKAEVI